MSKDFPHPPFSTVPPLPLGEGFSSFFDFFPYAFGEKVAARPDEGLKKMAESMKN